MADSQHTHTPSLTVSIPLEGMTWAELRAFVHLCRETPDEVLVGFVFDPHDFDRIGLEETVAASAVMPDGS